MSPPARPARLVVVTGTGTEIGKTWVSAALLRRARQRGLTVAARKPAQSYAPGDAVTDADQLAAASGEDPGQVCPAPRCYPVALAPPMAATALGLEPPDLASLAGQVAASWPAQPVDLGLVEGAGGVASPLADDGDSADLARVIGADAVVLVADPELGVISSVRLAVRALTGRPVIVHLNRFDPDRDLHRRNAAWLTDRERLVVTTGISGLLDALLDAVAGARPGAGG